MTIEELRRAFTLQDELTDEQIKNLPFLTEEEINQIKQLWHTETNHAEAEDAGQKSVEPIM